MFMPSYCVFWTSWDSILVFECVYWGPSFVFMEFWAHLHPHYTRVPTYFPNSVLRFCMWHWHSCLVFLFETPFEIRFGPPPIFELIGWYKKWGAYGFILLLLLVLCFCCVSWKFVLSIAIAKCHLHLYSIAPPHNHAHPQNPSSFTPHTIHSHHPSHPPSSPFHYSPPAWSSMHIATLIFSL